MKKFLTTLFLLACANLFATEGALKFGITPNNPNSRPSLSILLGFLSEKTGQKFELVEEEADKLIESLGNGEIAFADLTSSAYAAATSRYGEKIRYVTTVMARNEKGELVPYYKGIFYTLKQSPYKSPLDLKGKSFAFVSKTSTSGYIYPLATLSGMGIDPESFFGSITFAGEHEKIFEGLKNGFLDAAVSNYDAFEKAKALYGDIFKSIGETVEIPSGAIVASAKTDATIMERVGSALLSIKQTDPVVNYPGFLYKGFIKKGGGFYDFIKKLLKQSIEMPSHPYP